MKVQSLVIRGELQPVMLDLMSHHMNTDGSSHGGVQPLWVASQQRDKHVEFMLKSDTFQRAFVTRANETTESFFHCKQGEVEEERCLDPEERAQKYTSYQNSRWSLSTIPTLKENLLLITANCRSKTWFSDT